MCIFHDKVLWFTVLIALFCKVSSLAPSNTPCSGYGVCKCTFPDNYGIDLKNITTSLNATYEKKIISFHPCSDTMFEAPCDRSSVCMITHVDEAKSGNDTYMNLGTVDKAKLIWKRKVDRPMLEYKTDTTVTKIECSCDPNREKPQLSVISFDDTAHEYVLELLASECCIRSLSYGPKEHGSVIALLAIILLTMFLLYIIAGYLVMRFIRGAEGVEAIPNFEFWSSLPSKMKNGIVYLINGCQSPTTYDRI